MSSINNTVSLENPTWDFLHSNFRKAELQKHCRDIGITKVWVTKEKLIDLIMEKHRSSRPNVSENGVQDLEMNPRDVMNSVEELRERINIRDSEIEELNELLKTAHVTINRLNDRLSSMEEQVKQLQITHTQQTPQVLQGSSSPNFSPERTLILGDTNLKDIRTSDLTNQCSIRTIKGANTDLIKCWISEKLQWAPGNCILYCGLQDIMDGSLAEDILDRLGSLVAGLKQINEEMNIYICELVPVVRVQEYDESINNFNNQLATWSTNNGATVIKTNLQYRLGTGEVDQMCFHKDIENNGNFLNRYGVIRLLNIIAQQCSFLKLQKGWDATVGQPVPVQPSISSRSSYDHRSNPKPPGYDEERNHQKPYYYSRARSRFSRSSDNRPNHKNSYRHDIEYVEAYHTRQKDGERGKNYQYPSHGYHREHYTPPSHEERQQSSETNTNYRQYSQFRRLPNYPRQKEEPDNVSRRRPCYNCGEINHPFAQCRYEHRIKCNICEEYGHKTRLCHRSI